MLILGDVVAITSRNAGTVRTRTVGSSLYNMAVQTSNIISTQVRSSPLSSATSVPRRFAQLLIDFCIITATAPATLAVATLAALTPDYEVLTNQGDAPVSVYIDSVALQLNLSHHSNEHRILYVLHAPEYDSTVSFK